MNINSALYSAIDGTLVTPSDSTVFSGPTRALWVGGAGNVAVTMASGTVLTFSGITAGTMLPIQCTKVMATNTSGTLILALF